MEGFYPVMFGNCQVGKIQIIRSGLYYRFICRCQLTGDVISKLQMDCEGIQTVLGIVVPFDGGFGLDTRIPVKKIPKGKPFFYLKPNKEAVTDRFIPIYPEEPFSYIEKLKQSYLIRKGNQLGIIIKTEAV